MVRIRNIKLSVKVKRFSLHSVISILRKNKIEFSRFPNFITFNYKYTYIWFKTGGNNLNHINVTKIPKLSKINQSVSRIKNLFKCKVLSVVVDNIIATSDLCETVNLRSIIKKKCFHKVKYNCERFPGLFLKFSTGTIILFHSGKIVIVGCKNKNDIKCLIFKVAAAIKMK